MSIFLGHRDANFTDREDVLKELLLPLRSCICLYSAYAAVKRIGATQANYLFGNIETSRPLHGVLGGSSKLRAVSPIILPLEKAEALLPSGLGLDINQDSGVNEESDKSSTQTLITKEEKIEPSGRDMSLSFEGRINIAEGEEAGTQPAEIGRAHV